MVHQWTTLDTLLFSISAFVSSAISVKIYVVGLTGEAWGGFESNRKKSRLYHASTIVTGQISAWASFVFWPASYPVFLIAALPVCLIAGLAWLLVFDTAYEVWQTRRK